MVFDAFGCDSVGDASQRNVIHFDNLIPEFQKLRLSVFRIAGQWLPDKDSFVLTRPFFGANNPNAQGACVLAKVDAKHLRLGWVGLGCGSIIVGLLDDREFVDGH